VVALPGEAPPAQWVAAARWIHAERPLTAVASFGERDQDRLAVVAEDLGLPWHSSRTVRWVRCKSAMRDRLAACGLDDTAHRLVADERDLAAFVREVAGPVVVKPDDASGSMGVTLIAGPSETAEALARVAAAGDWSDGGVLAEAALAGPQLSVECFGAGGRHTVVGTTLKFSDPRTFVELGHVCPAPLAPATAEEVSRLVLAALDALEIGFGPTHTEVVLTPAGPRILETHVRLAGDDIPLLVRDVTGVDLEASTVAQVVTGGDGPLAPRPEGTRHEAAAVWFMACDQRGTVAAVRGEEEASALPGVVDCTVSVRPGDRVLPLGSSRDRIGAVRCAGADGDTALRRARTAAARVSVLVEARRDPYGPTV
jgi:biotin carboxylase